MPRPFVILKVADLDRTLEWYAAAGFAVRGREDMGESTWAEVEREGATIQFLSGATPWPGEPSLSGCLYVHAADIDTALADLRAPVHAEWGIESRPWGAREIVLRDPDGYYITLTTPGG